MFRALIVVRIFLALSARQDHPWGGSVRWGGVRLFPPWARGFGGVAVQTIRWEFVPAPRGWVHPGLPWGSPGIRAWVRLTFVEGRPGFAVPVIGLTFWSFGVTFTDRAWS